MRSTQVAQLENQSFKIAMCGCWWRLQIEEVPEIPGTALLENQQAR